MEKGEKDAEEGFKSWINLVICINIQNIYGFFFKDSIFLFHFKFIFCLAFTKVSILCHIIKFKIFEEKLKKNCINCINSKRLVDINGYRFRNGSACGTSVKVYITIKPNV